MRLTSVSTSSGPSILDLELDPDLTGRIWHPDPTGDPAPVVLLAHGGGMHVLAPAVAERASGLAMHGFAVVALNAPGHGGRPSTPEEERLRSALGAARGNPEELDAAVAAMNEHMAARAVPEWRAVLDALRSGQLPVRLDRVGFAGFSLGAAIGLAVIADEPRIRAANLGLIGHRFAEVARRVTIPVEFLLQWDDHLVPRESALRLFDALGSAEKTLHANPGGHGGAPAFEFESALRFFDRHLRDA